MVSKMDCIFCKIIAGKAGSYKVYEDEKTIAFLDINPVNAGHTLVIPKEHADKLSELSMDTMKSLSIALQKVIKGIECAMKPEGINIIVAQGRVAGQTIFHVHYHIIPRASGDSLRFDAIPRKMSEREFSEVAGKISDSIA